MLTILIRFLLQICSNLFTLPDLRGHNWVFFSTEAIVYCYLEFKLSLKKQEKQKQTTKKLKLFSIRVKQLFEPIV